jgi:hypothetical protein
LEVGFPIVDTTVTRTPRPCRASTSEQKVAISGKQDNLIEVIGQLHRVDRKFNAYVALLLTASLAIIKLFRWFRDNGEAVVVEPIDQRPQRGELLILDDHGVIGCAHQRTATLKLRQQALVVDVEAERPCGGMS